VAGRESVPPFVVASDRTLREVAVLRPRTLAELRRAHGIGPAKAEKYGDGLLAVVRGASDADGTTLASPLPVRPSRDGPAA
jgi:ATP-dependent DNA helicase RecQ